MCFLVSHTLLSYSWYLINVILLLNIPSHSSFQRFKGKESSKGGKLERIQDFSHMKRSWQLTDAAIAHLNRLNHNDVKYVNEFFRNSVKRDIKDLWRWFLMGWASEKCRCRGRGHVPAHSPTAATPSSRTLFRNRVGGKFQISPHDEHPCLWLCNSRY